MDVVYPVREGLNNEELRYSLRSLSNLACGVDNVWIVGGRPTFLRNVNHIPGNKFEMHKPRNVLGNWRIVAEHPDIADDFLMMNDDFFLMAPYTPTVTHRGLLSKQVDDMTDEQRANWWGTSLNNALEYLRGIGIEEPLSYELHGPLPVSKEKLRVTMEECGGFGDPHPAALRSVYGNRWTIGGVETGDCKVYGKRVPEWVDMETTPLLSTEDRSFKLYARDVIAKRFPDPSPYEKT